MGFRGVRFNTPLGFPCRHIPDLRLGSPDDISLNEGSGPRSLVIFANQAGDQDGVIVGIEKVKGRLLHAFIYRMGGGGEVDDVEEWGQDRALGDSRPGGERSG